MKKIFCIILTAIFMLALPVNSRAEALSAPTKVSSDMQIFFASASGSLSKNNVSPAANPVKCVFNPTQFAGKLQDCAYAGNGKLFAAADKLYLYDTATATVLATAEKPLRSFDVQTIDGGYILSGMSDSGMTTYIYDNSLSLNKKIAVNEILPEDFVVSETGVAATTDGKKLAIAAFGGLYLYDLEKEKLTTLLDLTKKSGTASIQISSLDGIAFSPDNSQIIFYGRGISIPAKNGENSFSIYGSIAANGSNLKITKPSAYDIEEMQSSTKRLFFPQIFTKANGTLLWLDRQTGEKKTLSFANKSEGRNGVYSSEQGNYVATAVLDGSLTIRVYDVNSGKLISTKVIKNSNSAYFNRIPRIYLLDNAKTAVVVLGASISEVDTLVSTFTFGE